MTPLALAILKEHLLPPSKRTFNDACGLLDMMGDIHCFEVSEVLDVARDLVRAPELTVEDQTGRFAAMAGRTSFLPAPKTWIEYRASGGRVGWLLTEVGSSVEIRNAGSREGSFLSLPEVCRFGLSHSGGDPMDVVVPAGVDTETAHGLMWQAIEMQAFLALINTPRVIGRQVHDPHRGAEKKLKAKRGDGFRLNKWTEIKLHIETTEEYSASSSERHLTGQKALHFCRAHLRMRLGRVEIVRAHWRGDATLGVKPARYTVKQ